MLLYHSIDILACFGGEHGGVGKISRRDVFDVMGIHDGSAVMMVEREWKEINKRQRVSGGGKLNRFTEQGA